MLPLIVGHPICLETHTKLAIPCPHPTMVLCDSAASISRGYPNSTLNKSAKASHGVGTRSIEGKKWKEKARHFAGDFWKCLALMATKWNSYRTVHFTNRHQNFFRATRGRLAGRSIEHSKKAKRCWLFFGSPAGCQNFGAFFRGTLKTSRRFSIEICYIERGQCCPPINLTSAKQHAKKKRKLVLN